MRLSPTDGASESDDCELEAERLRLFELTAEMRALRDRVKKSSPEL